MCDPITGTLMALQAVAGYQSYQEGQFNAEMQEEAFKANRQEAIAATMREARALSERRTEVREQAAQQKLDNRLETLRAKGRAQASESGVVQNANVLDREITRQGLRNADSIAANLRSQEAQLDRERAGLESRMNTRINSVARGVAPTRTAAILNTGANVLGTYSAGTKGTKKNPITIKSAD